MVESVSKAGFVSVVATRCLLVGIGEEWSSVFAGGYRRGVVF